MIEKGSTVTIHYTLRVDDEVVDSSVGKDPLTYVQGKGQLISGLEEELEGARPNEKKRITIPPERGYGERNEEAVRTVPKTAFQDAEGLGVGDVVSGKVGDADFRARVTEVTPENVTLDLNHPLAGKTLDFDVEVVEIR